MDKVVITIRKYRADASIVNGQLEEKNQRTISTYEETKSLLNVADPGAFKQKFIEDMGRTVYNRNRTAERKAFEQKSKTIEKLIISNIK